MDPPSQSLINLSTMEALENEDGNASHIAVIHVSDPQQPDPMQSQGRQQHHKTDSNKTDNNKLDIKNPNRKIQNNIKNRVNRKVVGRRWIHLPNHSSIFR